MPRSAEQLRRDALAIWQAGVDAVRSDVLVRQALRIDGSTLVIGDEELDLDRIDRIAVVGGGKAGAGMAAAVEAVLGPELMARKKLSGWVNVPDDCVRPLERIRLHPARPAGVNEPTEAGAAGAAAILDLVGSLGPRDLCLALISGGGSALLPAPVEAITLADKLAVTRHLSAAGANIEQLNTVRKQLSRLKGGGLARACRAGRLIALVISDVLGDPLDVIASGPTVEDSSTPQEAVAILEEFSAHQAGISPAVFEYLRAKAQAGEAGVPGPGFQAQNSEASDPRPSTLNSQPPTVTNLIIGNNATAVDAAGEEAVRLGYSPAMTSANRCEGPAEEIGRHLAEMAMRMRDPPGPDCLITGGEPVVRLVPAEHRGLGGRNQQLVLAAAVRLADDGGDGLVLLSGGTDGEDGPTDAAGALVDAAVLAAARERSLDPAAHLARNDAYNFFQPLGSLLKTGPTDTNVCDLRVVVVKRVELRET